MRKPSDLRAVCIDITEKQYCVLDLMRKHGEGVFDDFGKLIREALEDDLERLIFTLKDCAGVEVEKELAKRLDGKKKH